MIHFWKLRPSRPPSSSPTLHYSLEPSSGLNRGSGEGDPDGGDGVGRRGAGGYAAAVRGVARGQGARVAGVRRPPASARSSTKIRKPSTTSFKVRQQATFSPNVSIDPPAAMAPSRARLTHSERARLTRPPYIKPPAQAREGARRCWCTSTSRHPRRVLPRLNRGLMPRSRRSRPTATRPWRKTRVRPRTARTSPRGPRRAARRIRPRRRAARARARTRPRPSPPSPMRKRPSPTMRRLTTRVRNQPNPAG